MFDTSLFVHIFNTAGRLTLIAVLLLALYVLVTNDHLKWYESALKVVMAFLASLLIVGTVLSFIL